MSYYRFFLKKKKTFPLQNFYISMIFFFVKYSAIMDVNMPQHQSKVFSLHMEKE